MIDNVDKNVTAKIDSSEKKIRLGLGAIDHEKPNFKNFKNSLKEIFCIYHQSEGGSDRHDHTEGKDLQLSKGIRTEDNRKRSYGVDIRIAPRSKTLPNQEDCQESEYNEENAQCELDSYKVGGDQSSQMTTLRDRGRTPISSSIEMPSREGKPHKEVEDKEALRSKTQRDERITCEEMNEA